MDQSEHFVYAQGEVALVFDGGGSLTNRYLHGPEVDQVFADENALGEVLWPLADHQGTIRDLAEYDAGTDTTTVVNHRTYDSFGNVTAETNATVDHLFAYTGREWDGDAELYNYRARWYDPQAGRFVSEDPLGFDGGDVNLTRYVTNSPWNFTDPTGRIATSPLVQAATQIVTPVATNFVNTVTDWGAALGNWSGNGAPVFGDDGLDHSLDLAGGDENVDLQAGLAAVQSPPPSSSMPSRGYFRLNPEQQQQNSVTEMGLERLIQELEAHRALEYFRQTDSPIEQRPGETPLETLDRHMYERAIEAWESATLARPMSFEEYVETHIPNRYELERQGTPSIRALTPAE